LFANNKGEDVCQFLIDELSFAAGNLLEYDVSGRVKNGQPKGAKVYMSWAGLNDSGTGCLGEALIQRKDSSQYQKSVLC